MNKVELAAYNSGTRLADAYAYYNNYIDSIEVPEEERSEYESSMKKLEALDEMERYDIEYPEYNSFFRDVFVQAVALEKHPGSIEKHHVSFGINKYFKLFKLLRAWNNHSLW